MINYSPLFAKDTLIFSAIEGSVNSEISRIVMKEAYQRIGIEIEVKEYPGIRSLETSNAGEVDGELFRIANVHKKWTNLVMVPTPINKLEGVVFTKEVNFPVKGWESLKPYKIGVRRGIRFTDIGTQGMQRQIVDDNIALFKLLDMGRVDIIVIAFSNGFKILKQLQFSEVKSLHPPVASFPLHHYLHKKHQNLIPKLDAVLQDMAKEGLIQKIREQFLSKLH